MASSSGMSNLRNRKTVQSTSSSPDAVFGGGRLLPPDAVFDGGRLLPPCRSKKNNDNAKETQFSVLSSIPRETQNAPQLHDSNQIELTTIQRFQPPSFRPVPKAPSSQIASLKCSQLKAPVPKAPSSQIASQKCSQLKASSFQPVPKAPSSQVVSQKCSQPKAPISQPVLKAPSSKIASQTEGLSCQFDPLKSSVASISSDAPTIAIIPTKTLRDGSEVSEKSKMDVSSIDYWKNRAKFMEERVMEMKELDDIEDEILELISRARAFHRWFQEFEDSYFKSESPPCPEKVRETLAMSKKEREGMQQRFSELVRRKNMICYRPLPPH